MNKTLAIPNRCCVGISALAALTIFLEAPLAEAQSLIEQQANVAIVKGDKTESPRLEQRARVTYDTYILGPGDGLQVELLDLPELSGTFSIGPDGTLYLPRLRAINVEGLTVEELRYLLTEKFSTYVRDPQVYVRPIAYRPIRIYVGGEVRRPGYYTIGRNNELEKYGSGIDGDPSDITNLGPLGKTVTDVFQGGNMNTKGKYGRKDILPTVFDAIRNAQGVTPYSDLSKVQVTRKRAIGKGGGRIQTNLNFLSLLTEGDESQNIRLFDGDVVSVSRSNKVMRDQLLNAGKTNLSPQFMNVFVSGRVKNPGGVVVPQGAVLNQAISLAGGPMLIRGKVEFIRFSPKGEVDRRTFSYDAGASANSPNNPVLTAGDLINIRDSPLSSTTTVLSEIAAPAVSIYSIYSIFNLFN